MYPGVGGRINYGDSAKFQFLSVINGTPHATGYPLFLLISELFYRIIPADEVAYRITFISVLFGALAISMIYAIALLLSGSIPGSLFSSLVIGFSYTFWAQSTETEVYTLNAFFYSTVLLLFLKYNHSKNVKYLLMGSLFYAISFGNHLSMITLLPGIVLVTWMTDRKVFLNIRIILIVALFILLGMLQYAYIYCLAKSPSPYLESLQNDFDFSRFIDYVTGRQFKDNMFCFGWHDIINTRISIFLHHLNRDLTLIGMFAAVFGYFRYCFKKGNDPKIIFLTVALLCQFIYAINYRIPDVCVYFIPVFMVGSIAVSFIFIKPCKHVLVPAVLMAACVIVQVTDSLCFRDIAISENKLAMNESLRRIPQGSTLLVEENKTYKELQLERYYEYVNNLTVIISLNEEIPFERFYFTEACQDMVISNGFYEFERFTDKLWVATRRP
jgi:hypothetical protein